VTSFKRATWPYRRVAARTLAVKVYSPHRRVRQVDPEKIKDIKIVRTVVAGDTVYES
jgi:hypothetical protein